MWLYSMAIRIAATRDTKAKLWRDGRKNLFERMEKSIQPGQRIVWLHVASLGEFEQGRPIIERIRENYPEYKILLTFFSPSGYEVRKSYDMVDYIFYLPLDTTANARRFLDIVNPEIAIFVKYEYWLNLLFELRKRAIRSYIVSAIFRENSIFFKPWGFTWRNALESFETIFVQDENSKKVLGEIGFDNVVIAGDTRFDRVADIANATHAIDIVAQFKGDSKLFVAGSTWAPDEQIIEPLTRRYPDVKFLVAPHEIDDSHISQIMSLFGDRAIRYTQVAKEAMDARQLQGYQVLILDTMGMLSSTYQYGDYAYIGGGFGVGIHNTLEAATFALPIAFGTNYDKFKEAKDMISLGACCSISTVEELDSWFATLHRDEAALAKAKRAAREYTTNQCGATNIILRTIFCK